MVVAIIALLISILLPSLAKAREQAKKVYCSNNLSQFGRAINVYAGEYGYFCPHNPGPGYLPSDQANPTYPRDRFDPCIGWLLTYAMRMTPPEHMEDPVTKKSTNHFSWQALDEDELPDICVCPSAKRDLLFSPSPEVDLGNTPECMSYKYAAFYATGGTIRCGTPVCVASMWSPSKGGTNPPIARPGSKPKIADNAWPVGSQGSQHVPGVYLFAKTGDPMDATAHGDESYCYVQAANPSQIDNPGRVFYLCDSRDYRVRTGSGATQGYGAGQNDAWYLGWGNLLFLGTRHGGVCNVVYMDGHANSDNLTHPRPQWNKAYNWSTNDPASATSDIWEGCTWADDLCTTNSGNPANIHVQHHNMPILQIEGWENFFGSGKG